MLTVTIDQSEGISGADIPEQAVKKMRTGSAALSLPSPRAFFAFLFTERLSTTISEPGTGYYLHCICFLKSVWVLLLLLLLAHKDTMVLGGGALGCFLGGYVPPRTPN